MNNGPHALAEKTEKEKRYSLMTSLANVYAFVHMLSDLWRVSDLSSM